MNQASGGAAGGPATGGGGEGTDQGYATGYWVDRLREERTRHHAVELAHEATLKVLRADCDRLIQRAERAEKETVRWFNMSKELLGVAGEFAKLMAKP